MSSTASNYDTSKLIKGQGLGFIALGASTLAAGSTILGSVKTCYPIMLIGLLYGIMMFSSSYVEEEQHFWYWTSSAWVGLLWIKSYVPSPFLDLKLILLTVLGKGSSLHVS